MPISNDMKTSQTLANHENNKKKFIYFNLKGKFMDQSCLALVSSQLLKKGRGKSVPKSVTTLDKKANMDFDFLPGLSEEAFDVKVKQRPSSM